MPGGKLLKIFLEEEQGKIKTIKITGDFFLHPEEAIEQIEQLLVDQQRDAAILQEIINTFIKKNQVVMFGLDIQSLVATIMKAE